MKLEIVYFNLVWFTKK